MKSDQRTDGLLKTFNLPQCPTCVENFVGAELLLGQKRMVLHATESMTTIASKFPFLLEIAPKLQLIDEEKDAQLSSFMEEKIEMTSPFVLSLTNDADFYKILLTCFRLPETQSIAQIPRFLIKFRITEHFITFRWHYFVTIYNLSDAEIKLCRALMDGLTLDDCSHQWGITVNTLKTQLRNVFIKTSTHRQVDLLRLIHLILES